MGDKTRVGLVPHYYSSSTFCSNDHVEHVDRIVTASVHPSNPHYHTHKQIMFKITHDRRDRNDPLIGARFKAFDARSDESIVRSWQPFAILNNLEEEHWNCRLAIYKQSLFLFFDNGPIHVFTIPLDKIINKLINQVNPLEWTRAGTFDSHGCGFLGMFDPSPQHIYIFHKENIICYNAELKAFHADPKSRFGDDKNTKCNVSPSVEGLLEDEDLLMPRKSPAGYYWSRHCGGAIQWRNMAVVTGAFTNPSSSLRDYKDVFYTTFGSRQWTQLPSLKTSAAARNLVVVDDQLLAVDVENDIRIHKLNPSLTAWHTHVHILLSTTNHVLFL